MGKFLVDLIIYTFSVFGIVYYFNYLINSFKKKLYSAKIVLLIDDYKEIDMMINDVKNNIIDNKIASDAYIVVDEDIDKVLLSQENIKFIDRNELINLISSN